MSAPTQTTRQQPAFADANMARHWHAEHDPRYLGRMAGTGPVEREEEPQHWCQYDYGTQFGSHYREILGGQRIYDYYPPKGVEPLWAVLDARKDAGSGGPGGGRKDQGERDKGSGKGTRPEGGKRGYRDPDYAKNKEIELEY